MKHKTPQGFFFPSGVVFMFMYILNSQPVKLLFVHFFDLFDLISLFVAFFFSRKY